MNKIEYFVELGIHRTDRLRFRFKKDRGKIVDLVVQFEILVGEKWKAVVRYDCSHGFFHRDTISPDGSKEKKVIDVPDADVGIILSGTGSEMAFIQRLGRILRKKEGKEAVLYEIVSAETSEVNTARRRSATVKSTKPTIALLSGITSRGK